ncbi:MAG: TlpA disulfide reductase family protein [Pirellulaceae bacterium]
MVSGQAMRQGSVFIQQASATRSVEGPAAPEGMSAEMQTALLDLGKYEAALQAATTAAARTAAFEQYLQTMLSLYRLATTAEEKSDWIRQAADSIYLAEQSNQIANGQARLQQLAATLQRDNAPTDGIAYVEYRLIEYQYSTTPAENDTQYEARQTKWIADLEAFATKYADSEVAAQALSELAMLDEFAANQDKALERYETITTKYPNSELAARAQGALWRLTAEGKTINLTGSLITGAPYDPASYRNKTLVVHCWANWSDPQGAETNAIRAAQTKFASKGVQCIGVIVDQPAAEAQALARQQRINWPQIADEDGTLSTRFGLVTLPVIFIVDTDGKVLKVLDSAATLDDELETLLK